MKIFLKIEYIYFINKIRKKERKKKKERKMDLYYCCTNANISLIINCPWSIMKCDFNDVCDFAYHWSDVCTIEVWFWIVLSVCLLLLICMICVCLLIIITCNKKKSNNIETLLSDMTPVLSPHSINEGENSLI
jgi:hypothetical protein